MNIESGSNPEPGQVWVNRKTEVEYVVIDTIQSKDTAFNWLRHILYKEDGSQKLYSRRVSDFMDKFKYKRGDL